MPRKFCSDSIQGTEVTREKPLSKDEGGAHSQSIERFDHLDKPDVVFALGAEEAVAQRLDAEPLGEDERTKSPELEQILENFAPLPRLKIKKSKSSGEDDGLDVRQRDNCSNEGSLNQPKMA